MKKLLLLFLFAVIGLLANAQSGSDTLTAKATITGGDGTGRVVSYSWEAQGPGATVFSSPAGSVTIFTVTVPGTYTVTVKGTDNLGNAAYSTMSIVAYKNQSIQMDASKSSPVIIIK